MSILFKLYYHSFAILLAGDVQSNTESSSSTDKGPSSTQRNDKKENDGNAKDTNENETPNTGEVKTTEKPNGNFQGTKILSNGMEARKGNLLHRHLSIYSIG